MTYTFFPVPPVDTLNDHVGLFIVSLVMVFGLVIVFFNDVCDFRRMFVVCLVVFCLCAGISCNTGSITTYKNEAVQATFVGFVAEGYNEARASGKTIRHVDVHNTYVVYEVDGKRVLFDAQRGLEYPQIAMLYRN
jgi:hypothetical protein